MLVHHIKSITTAADTLPHRSSSVAPGKEPGSRTEFSSDKDAADIHVHAYASARPVARVGVRRGKNRFIGLHGN
ncbi:hypothetical protein [Polaromonas sp.]|uniref:hypothetical protein n=1 Tax=Polaromonas sp. TaxID=1869339 RepID=UPI003CBF1DD7